MQCALHLHLTSGFSQTRLICSHICSHSHMSLCVRILLSAVFVPLHTFPFILTRVFTGFGSWTLVRAHRASNRLGAYGLCMYRLKSYLQNSCHGILLSHGIRVSSSPLDVLICFHTFPYVSFLLARICPVSPDGARPFM